VGDVPYLVGVGIDISDWLTQVKVLQEEAWTDPLTQTANRRHFLEMATQEFARCRRYGHPLSVWMLDIDHFKVVNDTYGHQAGDLVLKSLVSTSQEALRDWDILGRMGGEEFAVVLPETESTQSMLVAERLRHAVASTTGVLDSGESAHITVSIGVATAHDDDPDLETLLKRADQALYEAKRSGRDKVCLAK
jgi:diguanylate cyclase (GGDEF)-like protein